jgi:hypothetical protein
VSDFLGGNRTKTDTNGTKSPNNRQHTPKATQDPKTHLANLATNISRTHTTETRKTVEVAHRCHRHHSSTSQRLRLHQEQPKEILTVTASRSPRRPMPNSRLIANKIGSSDSQYELQGEDVQDQRRRKSSRRDRPSPVIVATSPPGYSSDFI